ncbi:MAG: hypothetical protein HDT47_05985 [Ruminococcaceae bacterium]|nr:hypothetical protein [Oscillospiraceae bacterium]
MKKLELSFDYGTYFIWLYENGELIEPVGISSNGYFYCEGFNELRKYPEKRLIGQTELESKVNFINEEYSKLFINNEYEFSYKGYDSEENERRFYDAVKFVYEKLCELLEDEYEIINNTSANYR